MALTEQEFDLALRQLQELAALYGKKSSIVRTAQKFYNFRRATKKQVQLFFRRLCHKRVTKPQDRLKILVHVRGGIGDVCMTRMFVVRLRQKFPQALIYFAYDNQATVETVFSDGYIDGYVPNRYDPLEYDLVMSGCHAFHFDHADVARLQRLAPDWMSDFNKARKLQQKLWVVTHNTPHLDGIWAKISVAYGSTRIENLGLTTGIPVKQNDRAPIRLSPDRLKQTLQELGLAAISYITIHDGTNTNTNLHSRPATRCWPRTHWQEFARLFKLKYPHIKIVQLGGSNSAPFDFADICLVNKTTIAQLPYILQRSLVHIDGESGMAQLANLTQVRTVCLFGPTSIAYLGFTRNINIQAGDCRDCMCIIPDWMSKCILFNQNKCMQAILPQKVIQGVSQILTEQEAEKNRK